jgi:radical SAM protein with 4Fe4S-binding SPASM domain
MVTVNPNATYQEIRLRKDPHKGKEKSAPYREYRRKWEEYPQKQIVGEFPIHLDIETTNACNLRCPMCARTILIEKGQFPRRQFMPWDFYRNLIDQGADHGLYSVKLNYFGEPLLHPDVVEQVRYAKARGIIDVMMNTNATLLTEDLSRALLDAGLDKIFFSFDSHLKEEYEAIRVGANFEKTVENIKTFARIRNQNGYRGTEMRISMVLWPGEEEKFKALVAMWQGIVDTIGFGYYVERDPRKLKDHEPVRGFICAQPWQRLFVMVDGTVTACCADERREYVLGQADQEPLVKIWKGERLARLREAHSKGRYFEIAMCRKCYVPLVEKDRHRGAEIAQAAQSFS